MPSVKQIAFVILSFAIAMVLTCVANFLLQIAVIFLDVIKRWDASSAYVIVLWLVTGVFAAVFAPGIAEQFLQKEKGIYKLTGNVIVIISALAIALAISLLTAGHFRRNPQEFSLIFSNGYVFLSFFIGAGAMALILRNLD